MASAAAGRPNIIMGILPWPRKMVKGASSLRSTWSTNWRKMFRQPSTPS